MVLNDPQNVPFFGRIEVASDKQRFGLGALLLKPYQSARFCLEEIALPVTAAEPSLRIELHYGIDSEVDAEGSISTKPGYNFEPWEGVDA